MIDPPYLYGYLPGEREDSAAFWCHRDHREAPYLLVLVADGRIVSTLAWNMYPGGLSLHDSARVALSDFTYADDPGKARGPNGKLTEFPPLHSEYDGIITLFYRFGDRWLYRVLH